MVEVLLILLGSLSSDGCTIGQVNAEVCDFSGSLDNNGATLEGVIDSPGGGSIDIEGGGSGGSAGVSCDAFWLGECIANVTPPPTEGVTLADIAHFAPTVGEHHMEPNGWAVVGLPANFLSTATTQVLSGTVLGTPAEVRFTPVSWHWEYGDGATRDASTGGARWAALPLGEFEPTATSHVFEQRGDYAVTLSVGFVAEYRTGEGEWRRIPGILTLAAPPRDILARTARTVLVDEDCLRNPRGPGC